MLVATAWVEEHASDPGVVVVDMRWRGDGTGEELYRREHIPGAVYLDWSRDIVDPDHPIAFMLAPPERFARVMASRGITDDATVVAYADEGGSGPFRLWWACRAYGHDHVRVLDGGWEKWVAEGRPISHGSSKEAMEATWTPRPGPEVIATADEVADAGRDDQAVVVDSRPADQFEGKAVWFETGPVRADADGIARTPRGPLRAGHVPGARNVPSAQLYRPDHTMKSPDELRALFAEAGVKPGSRAITYCGVGISASALAFALARAGVENVKLYDASWEEWGRDQTRPVVPEGSRAG